ITTINGDTTTADGDDLTLYLNEASNPYDDNTLPPVSDPSNAAYDPNDAAFDPLETDQWPNITANLLGGINGGNVMPNDEIEYTIYYLSAGDTDAQDVLICDYVPEFTSFIPGAFNDGPHAQAPGGITGADLSVEVRQNGSPAYYTDADDGDSASYYGPGNDPASDFPGIDC
ncbi:MAG: hypothetical protein AAFV72_26885, partial [Cyanobacteria bacterium J06635_1]